MGTTLARRTIAWCDRTVEWTAVTGSDGGDPWPRNAVWSYRLNGLTFYAFPFDPVESETTTTLRALNWLNRHHLLLRRELLAEEVPITVR